MRFNITVEIMYNKTRINVEKTKTYLVSIKKKHYPKHVQLPHPPNTNVIQPGI